LKRCSYYDIVDASSNQADCGSIEAILLMRLRISRLHFPRLRSRGPIDSDFISRTTGGTQMAKVPSENYDRIVAALNRLGFAVTRQRGSHIRMERQLPDRTIRITVPAHRPVKRSTLSHIIKQAEISLADFLDAL
jgi:predicted RNA binding protein YcfA (HicA-like mRNA interferase family)